MTKLIVEVSSYAQLYLAWESVKKNKKSSPGIDQQTIEEYSLSLRANLRSLSKALKSGKYIFSPALEARIPKKTKSEYRRINIFTLKDKIVQKSIQITLEKKGEYFPDIRNSVSIGFLSKRGHKEIVGMSKAIEVIKRNYKKGFTVTTTADIKDFFNTIDRNKLYKVITRSIPDKTINKLISDCLSVAVMERDRFVRDHYSAITSSGVAQGSILSPLFSNIYLMKFDKELEKHNIAALRYADDVLIFSAVPTKAEETLNKVKGILLTTSNLEFYPKGTTKEPKHYPLKRFCIYLGLQIQIKKGRWEIFPIQKKVNELVKNIHDYLNPYGKEGFLQRVSYLDLSMSSWFNTYRNIGCTKRILNERFKSIEAEYYLYINKLLVHKGIISSFISKEKISFLTDFRNSRKKAF